MFPSLNIQKLRYDTIKKLEKEKKDQEDLKKLNEQKQKYQNMMNINHIKKSDSFKQVKEEYYDLKLLEKEFDDFLEYHQMFQKKDRGTRRCRSPWRPGSRRPRSRTGRR